MTDNHYPAVSVNFILDCVRDTGRLEENGEVYVGSTISFILKGPQAVFKRTCTVREFGPGEMPYENATALAIRLGFMGKLLEWLETNRSWKDGAYLEKVM